jgi:hypothetical protein
VWVAARVRLRSFASEEKSDRYAQLQAPRPTSPPLRPTARVSPQPPAPRSLRHCAPRRSLYGARRGPTKLGGLVRSARTSLTSHKRSPPTRAPRSLRHCAPRRSLYGARRGPTKLGGLVRSARTSLTSHKRSPPTRAPRSLRHCAPRRSLYGARRGPTKLGGLVRSARTSLTSHKRSPPTRAFERAATTLRARALATLLRPPVSPLPPPKPCKWGWGPTRSA